MASGEYRGEHLRAGPGKALSGARLGVGAFRLSSRLGWQIVSRLRSCPLRGVRATSKRRRPVTRSPPNLPTDRRGAGRGGAEGRRGKDPRRDRKRNLRTPGELSFLSPAQPLARRSRADSCTAWRGCKPSVAFEPVPSENTSFPNPRRADGVSGLVGPVETSTSSAPNPARTLCWQQRGRDEFLMVLSHHEWGWKYDHVLQMFLSETGARTADRA